MRCYMGVLKLGGLDYRTRATFVKTNIVLQLIYDIVNHPGIIK